MRAKVTAVGVAAAASTAVVSSRDSLGNEDTGKGGDTCAFVWSCPTADAEPHEKGAVYGAVAETEAAGRSRFPSYVEAGGRLPVTAVEMTGAMTAETLCTAEREAAGTAAARRADAYSTRAVNASTTIVSGRKAAVRRVTPTVKQATAAAVALIAGSVDRQDDTGTRKEVIGAGAPGNTNSGRRKRTPTSVLLFSSGKRLLSSSLLSWLQQAAKVATSASVNQGEKRLSQWQQRSAQQDDWTLQRTKKQQQRQQHSAQTGDWCNEQMPRSQRASRHQQLLQQSQESTWRQLQPDRLKSPPPQYQYLLPKSRSSLLKRCGHHVEVQNILERRHSVTEQAKCMYTVREPEAAEPVATIHAAEIHDATTAGIRPIGGGAIATPEKASEMQGGEECTSSSTERSEITRTNSLCSSRTQQRIASIAGGKRSSRPYERGNLEEGNNTFGVEWRGEGEIDGAMMQGTKSRGGGNCFDVQNDSASTGEDGKARLYPNSSGGKNKLIDSPMGSLHQRRYQQEGITEEMCKQIGSFAAILREKAEAALRLQLVQAATTTRATSLSHPAPASLSVAPKCTHQQLLQQQEREK